MHPGLKRTLHQRVQVARQTGASDYGDPTWGEPVEIPARIEPTTKIVMAPMGGQQFQAEILVIVESGIELEDRVTLPSGETRAARRVFAVPGALGGIDHLEVYL